MFITYPNFKKIGDKKVLPALAAPAASFWQAKKESLVVTKHDLRAIYNGKCNSNKT